jgi:predicted amidophosphoribosyltransferase
MQELLALRDMRNVRLCPVCQYEVLKENLTKVCDRCGDKFKDPQIEQQLKDFNPV